IKIDAFQQPSAADLRALREQGSLLSGLFHLNTSLTASSAILSRSAPIGRDSINFSSSTRLSKTFLKGLYALSFSCWIKYQSERLEMSYSRSARDRSRYTDCESLIILLMFA